MFKRFLALVMLFAMLSTVANATPEVKETAKINKAVTLLSDFGIIDLTKENPDDVVTRGEMVTFIAHIFNRGEIPNAEGACVFSDVTETSLVNAVMWAYKQKIVMGTGGDIFKPDNAITMYDAYLMVLRAMGYTKFSYVDIYAIDKNLKDKKNEDTVTYSDAATLLYNMLSCPAKGDIMLMETLYGRKGLKVLCFNTRNSYTGDGINSFIHRIGFVADKIYKEDPDIICMQELTAAKAYDMMKILLADYEIVGPGKNRGTTVTGTYIAVKKDTCNIVGWDSIWLSDSPHTPDSRFEEQGKSARICVQALIKHKKSGKNFRVFDTHLDNEKESARIKGIDVVFNFIDEYKDRGNYPIMLMGDLNSYPTDEVIAKCNRYGGITEVSENVDITFHKYGTEAKKLDYIFMSDELARIAGNTEAWTDMKSGIYLSDHYPICTQLWFE